MAVDVSLRDFGRRLRLDTHAAQRMIERVYLREVAERALARAIRIADDERITDRGTYKRMMRVRPVPGGWEVVNNAPHAAVIEHGRRPGARPPPLYGPNGDQRGGIYGWVRRKVIPGRSKRALREAMAAAIAIRKAIARRGLPPRNVVRRALDGAARDLEILIRERGLYHTRLTRAS